LLATLRATYEQGHISTADYERITTAQDYSREHLRRLRDHAHRFIPMHFGTAANWQPVYTLQDQNGAYIWLTCEDGQWLGHEGYPYSIFDE